MKYVLLLVGVALIYFVLVRNSPVKAVAQTVTAQEAAPLTTNPQQPPAAAPATTALKRPIDRTREVLGQVKQRNGTGEF
jgi:hypothetical protein